MDRPPFDELKARRLVGKTVLIGIDYEDSEGTLIEQKQFFGTVLAADERTIDIELQDGTPFALPPDPRAFFEAPPGEYRLRSTGQVIVDPEYTTTWTRKATKKEEH